MNPILKEALEKGIYAIVVYEDTNSYGIYYISPTNLRVEDGKLKGLYREFDLEDYNKYWSLYKEAFE